MPIPQDAASSSKPRTTSNGTRVRLWVQPEPSARGGHAGQPGPVASFAVHRCWCGGRGCPSTASLSQDGRSIASLSQERCSVLSSGRAASKRHRMHRSRQEAILKPMGTAVSSVRGTGCSASRTGMLNRTYGAPPALGRLLPGDLLSEFRRQDDGPRMDPVAFIDADWSGPIQRSRRPGR